jgi:glutamate dehydrogenase/leucine dehydrogenase
MFYDSAAAKTGIDPQWLNLIKACQSVVRFNIPLRRDNGQLEVVTCYR